MVARAARRKAVSVTLPEPRRRAGDAFGRVLRCAAGVSAIEFALVAPVLVIGAFSTADVGMAVHERMMIGQALRAGAQLAMTGASDADIREALQSVAAENFAASWEGTAEQDSLVLDVESYCICPGETIEEVDCAVTCDAGASARRVIRLSARKMFHGVMLPEFPISASVDVLAE
jgi:pilus assembly protein CpaE